MNFDTFRNPSFTSKNILSKFRHSESISYGVKGEDLKKHSNKSNKAEKQESLQKEAVTEEMVRSHGLSGSEYETLLSILGREPNLCELGIFSVMWSEHCSYKSSRVWLSCLPTESDRVICGPGENAGIIDIGDGLACIFKIESHNHPSFIEPHQGAATGVGGIMRDVFTMGARPIANLDAIIFGNPESERMRYLVEGVVSGIGGYGNSFGVPTVGGLTEFDSSYDGNILVNAMSVGLADRDKIFYAKAGGVGNSVVYVGAKTGRDGIHGATMASSEFGSDSGSQRPTVQVGVPIMEKLLMEACLELMASGNVVAIQDMGAAGLTSSSVEMASKGGVGLRMDLSLVPVRESGMTSYEIMLSESQERMLLVLEPEHVDFARVIFDKWDLDFAVVGEITGGGNLELYCGDSLEASIPVVSLVEESPKYERPYSIAERPTEVKVAESILPLGDILEMLLGCEHFADRKWIYRQYDYLIRGETLVPPGMASSAVVSIPGSVKALALNLSAAPRYCLQDSRAGGMQVVAQAWRSLVAVGAEPIALTNNLNFGNPEKPEIMGQFVGVIEGMREACLALEFPVVSGNVSLYNETAGRPIMPTPVIGGVGLLEDKGTCVDRGGARESMEAWLVGDADGGLSASRYQQIVHGEISGCPPPLDLAEELRIGGVVRGLIESGDIVSCDVIGDGGLLVSLYKIVVASGVGIDMGVLGDCSHEFLFGEHQSCYVVVGGSGLGVRLSDCGVIFCRVGVFGGDSMVFGDGGKILVDKLVSVNHNWFGGYMSGD